MRHGTGIPTLAVLVTVAFWYLGDVFYNDYVNNHVVLFTETNLAKAWWQVAWFLIVFLVAIPDLHERLNARYLGRESGSLQLFQQGVGQPLFQKQLLQLFNASALLWTVLAVIALILLRERALHFFFPFFGEKTSPWVHGRIGKGFDSLSIIAIYLHLLVAAVFGVVAALTTQRRILILALFCCLTAWPYFVLDRTRNTILAIVVPGLVSWVFLRLRGGMLKKAAVLGIFFVLINAWMGFVIANRTGTTIIAALQEKGFSVKENQKVRHEGLNMFEELCWINTFMELGTYNCNWGYRYFTEVVNPIPRALWSGKPTIGLDYALARGQGGADSGDAGGVYATISTGMIGQGVVNFSTIIGPACSALLMSLWVVVLARMDLQIHEFGRLPLYGLGLILTFNLGRDITLITLYPFVFGAMLVWWYERSQARKVHHPVRPHSSRPQLAAPRSPRPASSAAFGHRRKPRVIPRRPVHSRPLDPVDSAGTKASGTSREIEI